MTRGRWWHLAGGMLATAALLGCAPEPAPSPPVPTLAGTTTTVSATTTSAAPRLPDTCGDVLTTQQVDLALGRPLVGRVRSIVGVPEPAINRLERLTCQYGLPEEASGGAAPAVPLEVSVSRYADERSATERVADTVESERARGAAPATVAVAGVSGTVLVTADRRLLVASDGPVTVAVTMLPGLADDRAADVLSDLGGQALTAVT